MFVSYIELRLIFFKSHLNVNAQMRTEIDLNASEIDLSDSEIDVNEFKIDFNLIKIEFKIEFRIYLRLVQIGSISVQIVYKKTKKCQIKLDIK